MTDTQLTALSTIAWLVGTMGLFVLLARWSAGGSWGIAAAVVRGVTGWAGRPPPAGARSPSGDELPPLALPPPERPILGRSEIESPAGDRATGPAAEIEELPARRI